jgi:hypothetical protein
MHTNPPQSSTSGFAGVFGDRSTQDIPLEELFDLLMGSIEPELTSAQIPLLDAKYKDETPEEKKLRGERYAAAFAQFEQTFALLMEAWDRSLAAFRDSAISGSKGRVAAQDVQRLEDIGGLIQDA